MAVVLDTRSVPAGERLRAVQETFCDQTTTSVLVKFDCPSHEVQHFSEQWRLGSAVLLRSRASVGIRLQRTAQLVRRNTPNSVTFGFQIAGSGFHTQHGLTTEQAEGHLSILDFRFPWHFGLGPDSARGSLVLDVDELGLSTETVRRAAASVRRSPLHGLLHRHLVALTGVADEVPDAQDAAMLGRATVDLARALVATAAVDDPVHTDAWQDTLGLRLMAYLRDHLQDRDMTPETIAAAHAVSVRQLYKL